MLVHYCVRTCNSLSPEDCLDGLFILASESSLKENVSNYLLHLGEVFTKEEYCVCFKRRSSKLILKSLPVFQWGGSALCRDVHFHKALQWAAGGWKKKMLCYKESIQELFKIKTYGWNTGRLKRFGRCRKCKLKVYNWFRRCPR